MALFCLIKDWNVCFILFISYFSMGIEGEMQYLGCVNNLLEEECFSNNPTFKSFPIFSSHCTWMLSQSHCKALYSQDSFQIKTINISLGKKKNEPSFDFGWNSFWYRFLSIVPIACAYHLLRLKGDPMTVIVPVQGKWCTEVFASSSDQSLHCENCF